MQQATTIQAAELWTAFAEVTQIIHSMANNRDSTPSGIHVQEIAIANSDDLSDHILCRGSKISLCPDMTRWVTSLLIITPFMLHCPLPHLTQCWQPTVSQILFLSGPSLHFSLSLIWQMHCIQMWVYLGLIYFRNDIYDKVLIQKNKKLFFYCIHFGLSTRVEHEEDHVISVQMQSIVAYGPIYFGNEGRVVLHVFTTVRRQGKKWERWKWFWTETILPHQAPEANGALRDISRLRNKQIWSYLLKTFSRGVFQFFY